MIGEYIKEFREEKGWTQEELAKKAGLSRVAIGNYERGDRSPTLATLQKISKALKVPTDYFVDGMEYRQLIRADVQEYSGDGLLAYLHHLNCDNYPLKKEGRKGYSIIMKDEHKAVFIDFETLNKLETLVEADIKKMLLAFGELSKLGE